MKNRLFKFIFPLTFFLSLIIFVLPVRAEESKTIHLKVAALDQILYDDDFTVTACPDNDNASTTELTVNAWCALDQLTSNQGWNATSTWYDSGVLLNGINQYDGADGNFWLWFSNNEAGTSSLNQHVLTDGENLLLAYGTGPLKLTATELTPDINATSTISVSTFDVFSWQWLPAASSTLVINGQEVANDSGSYDLWPVTTTPYVITAKKGGFLNSDALTITSTLPGLNIELRIETASTTLFDNELKVAACETDPGAGIYTINGRCALDQSGLTTAWTEWGSDAFLNSIANLANNQDGNGIYWQWFSDLDYGQTALNNHVLSPKENLLLTYGINPLKISAATTSPALDATTTVTLEQFDLDTNWNPVWSPAASSTLNINGQLASTTGGIYQLLIATTSPYAIYGHKEGYLDSPTLVLNGIMQTSTSTPSDNSNSNNSGSIGVDMGGGQTHQSINIDQAVNFLISQQRSDGSIAASILYSDWSAMALAASGNSDAKNKLKDYLLTAGYSAGLSATADLERRAMALEALGVNPYNGTAMDFIAQIVSTFDGTQIGDPTIYNDDIFALFPLLKAGYTASDNVIKETIDFILSKQNDNGSWENIDLMAATIQALELAKNKSSLNQTQITAVDQALDKAKYYLHNSQQADGGFGNAISTSWAIQAIISLNESTTNWQMNGHNPLDYLIARQQIDGGLESLSTEMGTRIWTTAYTIPAVLGKTWDMILNNFAKPSQDQLSQNISGGAGNLLNLIATSTQENATSTPIIATSTPNNAIETPINEMVASSSTEETSSKIISIKKPNVIIPSKPVVKGYSAEFDSKIGQSANQTENQTQLNQINKPAGSTSTTDQINSTGQNNLSGQSNTIKIIFYFAAGLTILFGLFLSVRLIKSIMLK